MVYLSRVLSFLGIFASCILLLCPNLALATEKHQHVVFFIHGLQGDSTSFCDFPEKLKRDIEKAKPNLEVFSKSLDYSTFEEQSVFSTIFEAKTFKAVELYAGEIRARIALYYKDNNLDVNNVPYSLVVHSQGGLVAAKFVQHCVWGTLKSGKNRCDTRQEDIDAGVLPPHVLAGGKLPMPLNLKHIITLGSPHHGSPGANFLQIGLTGLFENLIATLTGTQYQIADLSLGSSSIKETRDFLISKATPSGWKSPFKEGELKLETQFHNIVGNIDQSQLGLFAQQVVNNRVETDVVVDAASAYMDFNYYVENATDDQKPLVGRTELVRSQKHANYMLNQYAHTLEPPLVKFEESIQCVRDNEPHATYTYVRNVFTRNDLSGEGAALEAAFDDDLLPPSTPLKNYLTDIHVFFDKKLNRGPDITAMQVTPASGTVKASEIFAVENTLVNKHWGYNRLEFENGNSPIEQNRLVFFHQGHLDEAYQLNTTQNGGLSTHGSAASPDREMVYTISHPGFETRQVSLPINAGMSTYAKIFLKQYIPSSLQQALPYTEALAQISGEQYYNSSLKEKLDRIPMAGQGVCALGVMAPANPTGKGRMLPNVYTNFFSPSEEPKENYRKRISDSVSSYHDDDHLYVRVIGRFQSADGKIDRYLILKEGLKLGNQKDGDPDYLSLQEGSNLRFGGSVGWTGDAGQVTIGFMDIKDIDIREGEACPGWVLN